MCAERDVLTLAVQRTLMVENSGYFISRGKGRHPERVIATHELIHVEQGELRIFEGEREFTVRAGENLILFPGRRHGGTCAYLPDLRFYWLHFNPITGAAVTKAGAPQWSEQAFGWDIPQWTPAREEERQLWLWRRLLDDQENGCLTPSSAQHLLLLLLEEVVRGGRAGQSAEYILAQKIENLISTKFHEPISAGQIARDLGYNPDYLARLYRKAYQRTITCGLHLRRLRHAKGLLLGSDFNINEIARESGFGDPAQFRKIFARHEGITPSEYRALSARMHSNTL